MPHQTFQELFDAVATRLGLQPEPLQPDEYGQLSFRLDFGGHAIDVVQCRDGSGQPLVVLAADLGPLPTGEGSLPPTSLLDANLMLASTRGPVFGRDPGTGHILLHHSHALSDLDGPGVQAVASALAEMAHWWRSDMFRSMCRDVGRAMQAGATVSRGSAAPSAPSDFA